MERIAGIMYLYPGNQEEYQKRHNDLWPEMKKELKAHGAMNYSIFLDKGNDQLFAYLEVNNKSQYDEISQTAVCKKWWKSMALLMKSNPDCSPVWTDLAEVFHLD